MSEGTSRPADQPKRPRAAQGSRRTGRKQTQQARPAPMPEHGDQMHPEGTQLIAQALLSEAERLAVTLPVLRQQQAETQALLEQAREGGTKDEIRALEKTLRRLERVISLRSQVVPELREEGERLLASLRAEDQAIRPQPQA